MSDDKHDISFMPTEGKSYDPTEPGYFDPAGLKKELIRAYALCHSCRMCFKFCDSFPLLFDLIDEKYDGDVRGITDSENDRIMDACFQCKLCEVQCPYTPRDKHEFELDFPKLVHRYKSVRAKQRGMTFRDRVLGDPDAAGMAARASLGLANMANRMGVARFFMEKTLGIHRNKLLPSFAKQTFEDWAIQTGRVRNDHEAEVVLFHTCFVQHNDPTIGMDVIDVFAKNDVDCACVQGLQCCGMPAWEHGDLASLRRQAHVNLNLLLPYVEKGAKVLAINPTCSMMMRREYEDLLEGEDRRRAKILAEAVMDPSEYLWSIRNQPRFNTHFRSRPPGGKVAYHAPCHLRAQSKGFKGRDILKKIPGVKPVTVMECCGHNGTFAMTVEGFDASKRLGKKAFDGMMAVDAEVWASDCPLAAIQFQQHTGIKPMHPITILARAYRADGFSEKIPAPEDPAEETTP